MSVTGQFVLRIWILAREIMNGAVQTESSGVKEATINLIQVCRMQKKKCASTNQANQRILK